MNIDLTHPEILTIEQLQKFVGSEEINDRYELIQLFYKYVAPLPQRKFRMNRWGTMLTDSQQQIREENSTNCIDVEMTEKKTSKIVIEHRTNRESTLSQGERHQSDRGIYTIIRQKSARQNTAPIKLKRPSSSIISDDNQKRPKPNDSTSS